MSEKETSSQRGSSIKHARNHRDKGRQDNRESKEQRTFIRSKEDEDRDIFTDEEERRRKYLHPDGKLRFERPPSDLTASKA